jgi:hypothetical protein
MPQTKFSTLTYTDLDRLSGETLPGRLLLSAASGRSGSDIAYACQYVHYSGTSGILETGLLAEPEHTTVTCVPVLLHHKS